MNEVNDVSESTRVAFTRIVPLRFCPVHMVIVSAKDMKLSFYNN